MNKPRKIADEQTIARQITKYLVPVTEDINYDYSKINFENIIIPHNEH